MHKINRNKAQMLTETVQKYDGLMHYLQLLRAKTNAGFFLVLAFFIKEKSKCSLDLLWLVIIGTNVDLS